MNFDRIHIVKPALFWPPRVILAANTNRDGTGVVETVFQAGANDAFCRHVVVCPLGTNAQTVVRIFLNNGGLNAIPSNNQLIAEATIGATTTSELKDMPMIRIEILRRIPAGYRITYCLGTAVAAGFGVTAFGGCLGDDPELVLEPISAQFVGDSVTEGMGSRSFRPMVIDALTERGFDVTCKGSRSGSSTGDETWLLHDGWPGYDSSHFTGALVTPQTVNVAILMIGINDAFTVGNSAAAWAANMEIVRDRWEATSDAVIIVTPYAGNWSAGPTALIDDYDAIADTLATSKTVICHGVKDGFDFPTMLRFAPDDLVTDPTHPNDYPGNVFIATGPDTILDCGIANGIW